MQNKLIVFSDLHIKEDWSDNLDEIKRIIEKENNNKSVIIFNGDTLHKPALLGSPASIYLSGLLSYLEEISKLGSVVIFLQGTLSHDGDWMQLMKSEYQTIGFIDCITEVIINDENFLFIPELYNISKEEYNAVLSKKYNYIFGHGTVAGYFTSGSTDKDETIERTLLSAPVFDRNNFKADYTIFGHYHNFVESILDDTTFIYVGSFVTNTFGEIDPIHKKGALIIEDSGQRREINLKDLKYEEIWIRNLDDISKCISFQNDNIKVRAIISDDTLPTYIKAVVNTVRNIKDVRTRVEKSNIFETKNSESSLENEKENFLAKIFSTYNTEGLLSTILLYAKENKISNIEEKFLLEIEKSL